MAGPGALGQISTMASAGEILVPVAVPIRRYRIAVMYCDRMKLSILTSTSGGTSP
jgi:hypothetical protein